MVNRMSISVDDSLVARKIDYGFQAIQKAATEVDNPWTSLQRG